MKNTIPQFSQNDTLRSIQIFLWALKEYIYNGEQNDFLNRLEQIDIAQHYKNTNANNIFGNKK